MSKTALVIGATGATGKDLVAQLLEDAAFDNVHIFVRRDVDLHHDKRVRTLEPKDLWKL